MDRINLSKTKADSSQTVMSAKKSILQTASLPEKKKDSERKKTNLKVKAREEQFLM